MPVYFESSIQSSASTYYVHTTKLRAEIKRLNEEKAAAFKSKLETLRIVHSIHRKKVKELEEKIEALMKK